MMNTPRSLSLLSPKLKNMGTLPQTAQQALTRSWTSSLMRSPVMPPVFWWKAQTLPVQAMCSPFWFVWPVSMPWTELRIFWEFCWDVRKHAALPLQLIWAMAPTVRVAMTNPWASYVSVALLIMKKLADAPPIVCVNWKKMSAALSKTSDFYAISSLVT